MYISTLQIPNPQKSCCLLSHILHSSSHSTILEPPHIALLRLHEGIQKSLTYLSQSTQYLPPTLKTHMFGNYLHHQYLHPQYLHNQHFIHELFTYICRCHPSTYQLKEEVYAKSRI